MRLYTLVVFLTDGPVSKKFDGKTVSRTIQILGRQRLNDLHYAIFNAFDREEQHLYEFNLGTGPAERSCLYSPSAGIGEDEDMGSSRKTTMDSLNLKVGQWFGYTFDMGDNWQHTIQVRNIGPCPAKGRFPAVIEKLGDSPPQYADPEEE